MTPRIRPAQRTLVLCLVAMAAWLLVACGGRFRTINEVDDDTPGGAGQSSAGAASAGRAGAVSGGAFSAGASAGGAPSAGAPTSAGASSGGACGNVDCPLVKCAAGYSAVVLPGKCCPVCQLTCQEVACPAVACGPGSHPEVPAGACCPVCVDDAGYQCQKGKDLYAEQRAQYLEKYSYGCMTDADCTVVAPSNQCEPGCQYEALWKAVANNFTQNLNSLASMSCATCGMQPIPPCPPPPSPVCVMSRCAFPLN